MNAAYIYLQLYRLFDKSTPIPADCGRLCGKACCKGDDCGMFLFPGEEEVYKLLDPDWVKIESTDFSYTYNGKTYRTPLATCTSECDRYQRPLACRIFPLTPYTDKAGRLEIITDPRAKGICPLAKVLKLEEYDRGFVNNVEKTFRLLMRSRLFSAFMKEYSEYLDEFRRFF